MIKGQDIVVLAALMDSHRQKDTYSELGAHVRLSASETHAAVSRLLDAGLITAEHRALRHNAMEFLAHGIRYTFPLRPAGVMAKGLPTAYAAPVAEGHFAATGTCPVWSWSEGGIYGQSVEPLYKTAPEAAANDRGLYDRLALIDMLRGGRLRERIFAQKKLEEAMQ